MERYEAYKDSGVEWIGEIPSTWTLARTKAVFSSKKRVVGDKANEYQRLALTMHGVLLRDKDDNEGLQPEQFEGYQILEANELVFKLIDLENIKTSRVGLSPYTGIVSPAYITLTQTDSDNRYFYYWFFALYQQNVFNQLGGNGVRSALNKDDLLNLPMLLPKQDEQRAIANYLDARTAEIDALVADCEREAELLREYRKAVISEAVTKGLDPDAPMKDSGIEWIGEIPANWNMMQLGRLCIRIFDGPFGSNLKSNDYVDEGIRVVRLENLKYLQFDATKESFVTPEKYESIKQHTVYPDDLIVATFIIDSVKACRLPKDVEFAVNKADCLGVRTGDDIETDFLKYYLSSCQVFEYLVGLTHGSTRQRINTTQLKTLLTLLPPIRIQQEIVAYLDGLCAEIDSLIEIKQSMADKLREYRRSLISEAVTGKFKVPGV